MKHCTIEQLMGELPEGTSFPLMVPCDRETGAVDLDYFSLGRDIGQQVTE